VVDSHYRFDLFQEVHAVAGKAFQLEATPEHSGTVGELFCGVIKKKGEEEEFGLSDNIVHYTYSQENEEYREPEVWEDERS